MPMARPIILIAENPLLRNKFLKATLKKFLIIYLGCGVNEDAFFEQTYLCQQSAGRSS